MSSSDPAQVPQGWSLGHDQSNGRPFFINMQNGRTQWEHPYSNVQPPNEAKGYMGHPPPPSQPGSGPGQGQGYGAGYGQMRPQQAQSQSYSYNQGGPNQQQSQNPYNRQGQGYGDGYGQIQSQQRPQPQSFGSNQGGPNQQQPQTSYDRQGQTQSFQGSNSRTGQSSYGYPNDPRNFQQQLYQNDHPGQPSSFNNAPAQGPPGSAQSYYQPSQENKTQYSQPQGPSVPKSSNIGFNQSQSYSGSVYNQPAYSPPPYSGQPSNPASSSLNPDPSLPRPNRYNSSPNQGTSLPAFGYGAGASGAPPPGPGPAPQIAPQQWYPGGPSKVSGPPVPGTVAAASMSEQDRKKAGFLGGHGGYLASGLGGAALGAFATHEWDKHKKKEEREKYESQINSLQSQLSASHLHEQQVANTAKMNSQPSLTPRLHGPSYSGPTHASRPVNVRTGSRQSYSNWGSSGGSSWDAPAPVVFVEGRNEIVVVNDENEDEEIVEEEENGDEEIVEEEGNGDVEIVEEDSDGDVEVVEEDADGNVEVVEEDGDDNSDGSDQDGDGSDNGSGDDDGSNGDDDDNDDGSDDNNDNDDGSDDNNDDSNDENDNN